MIAHTSLAVGNYRKSKEFYIKALAPSGTATTWSTAKRPASTTARTRISGSRSRIPSCRRMWRSRQRIERRSRRSTRQRWSRWQGQRRFRAGPSTGPATTPRSCTTFYQQHRGCLVRLQQGGEANGTSLRVTRAFAMKVQRCRLPMTLAALIWCVPSAGASHEGGEDGLLVFAAASLTDVLARSVRSTSRRPGSGSSSFAASSALARQIEAARADLFVSADLEWMDIIADRQADRGGFAPKRRRESAGADRPGRQHSADRSYRWARSAQHARGASSRDCRPGHRTGWSIREGRAGDATRLVGGQRLAGARGERPCRARLCRDRRDAARHRVRNRCASSRASVSSGHSRPKAIRRFATRRR